MGDATAAYGGRLVRFHRHVAFVKPETGAAASLPFIVLYDDLEAKAPSTFQFMLHALRPCEIDESRSRLTTEQPHAGVEVQYLSTTALRFRQWDGFAPPPSREFPNQWHVETGTGGKQSKLAMLTLIVPYRRDHRPPWTAERVETDTTVGLELVSGGKRTTISIPKSDDSRAVRVERK
jgi:hypothetical protein